MLAGIGGAQEATVFGSGERLPLMHAAMLNAYQIHGQEFDCVHEAAVVHPMAAVLPALLGWAEREGGVSGARLIRAVVGPIERPPVAVLHYFRLRVDETLDDYIAVARRQPLFELRRPSLKAEAKGNGMKNRL